MLSITPVIAHNPRRPGLRPWQQAVNVVVKTVRPRIEPVSGTLKRSFGLARARCLSLARNLVDVGLRVLAFDLRRLVGLLRDATRPPGAQSARSPAAPRGTDLKPGDNRGGSPRPRRILRSPRPSRDRPTRCGVLRGGLVIPG